MTAERIFDSDAPFFSRFLSQYTERLENAAESPQVPLRKAVNSSMDDSMILSLFAARSEQAIRETEARYGRLMQKLAYQILGSTEDAEECVSDVLLQVWNAIPPEKPEYFRAYLAAMTRNAALNRYAANTAQKRGAGSVPAALDELSECIPARESVVQTVEQRAVIEALERFLKRLPQKHARVFMLRYFSMLSLSEVAEETALPENTVKSILKRTRKKLCGELKKEELL